MFHARPVDFCLNEEYVLDERGNPRFPRFGHSSSDHYAGSSYDPGPDYDASYQLGPAFVRFGHEESEYPDDDDDDDDRYDVEDRDDRDYHSSRFDDRDGHSSRFDDRDGHSSRFDDRDGHSSRFDDRDASEPWMARHSETNRLRQRNSIIGPDRDDSVRTSRHQQHHEVSFTSPAFPANEFRMQMQTMPKRQFQGMVEDVFHTNRDVKDVIAEAEKTGEIRLAAKLSGLSERREMREQLHGHGVDETCGYKDMYKSSKSGETEKLQEGKTFRRNCCRPCNRILSEIWNSFELWRSSFKIIEGNFGSSVVSYFRFLKWLLVLNFIISMLVIAFVMVPSFLIAEPKTFEASVCHTQNCSDLSEAQNQAQVCTELYDEALTRRTKEESLGGKIGNLFLGTGWLEKHLIFYGYYFNKGLRDGNPKGYDLAIGYLLTCAAYFLISLIGIVWYMAKGVRESSRIVDGKFNLNCNRVFCGWDFALMKKRAAKLKHKNFVSELKNDLEEQRLAERRADMNCMNKFRIFVARVIVNVLVLGIWALCGYLIILATNKSVLFKDDGNIFIRLFGEYLSSLTITILNVLVPPIVTFLVRFEDYSPQFQVKAIIFRIVFLRLASIAVLVVTLKSLIDRCYGGSGKDGQREMCPACNGVGYCWETFVGQEFYKLVILDLIVALLIPLLFHLPRKLLVDAATKASSCTFVGISEFDLPKSILDLVYSQTLVWIGTYFCPLIPLITVVKLFIVFYIKKYTLLKRLNRAPEVQYRASRSNSFFMNILVLAYVLLGVVPIAYAVGRVVSSRSCGVFRVHVDRGFAYEAWMDMVARWPKLVRQIVSFVGSYTFVVPAVIILSLMIYYYTAVAAGNRKRIKILEKQLALEGKDKQFLVYQVRMLLHNRN